MIEKLIKIQNELKAPKNQYNSFGKYSYRNAEDIFEAAKPICFKYGLLLTVTDQIIEVGGSLFVEATATITDGEKMIASRAQAGLDLNRKGMDKAQSTGASSSYARKYAMSGLMMLDDSKDSDATSTVVNNRKSAKTAPGKDDLKENSEAYLNVITALRSGKYTIEDVMSKYVVSKELQAKLKSL